MDFNDLANNAVNTLAPALPFLMERGADVASRALDKLGESAWKLSQSLWETLREKLLARPAAEEAAQDCAKHPQDEDARAALRLQLKKLLASDPALAQDLATLFPQAPRSPPAASAPSPLPATPTGP